jgi:pilus assembly protein CpaB
MNKNVAIIMGGALMAAIVVALIVNARMPSSPKQAKSDGVEILVANKKLLTGETLKAENVHWEGWAENNTFSGVIRKKDQPDPKNLEVYGTPVRRDIESGEPVTTQALIDSKGASNFLTASISPNMRAMSINVTAQSSVGGFISPGDYVDVILTYKAKVAASMRVYTQDMFQEHASQTVMRNVKVLAIDQKAKGDNAEAKIGKTVTLEVTEKGAETLALASGMGTLSLTLRRLGDKSVPDGPTPMTTDVTTSNVLREATKKAIQAEHSTSIKIYNGTAVQNIPVQGAPSAVPE